MLPRCLKCKSLLVDDFCEACEEVRLDEAQDEVLEEDKRENDKMDKMDKMEADAVERWRISYGYEHGSLPND